jgi:hypothetical protein
MGTIRTMTQNIRRSGYGWFAARPAADAYLTRGRSRCTATEHQEQPSGLRDFSDWGRCSQAAFFFYRSSRSIVGLITPVTAWRLNVSKGRQVEIDDGFERVGCRAALEAIGKCREPVGVPSLQRK